MILFRQDGIPVPLNPQQQAAVEAANHSTNPTVVLFAVVLLVFYFMPTIMAIRRKQPNTAVIVLCNVFLGWSVIGWVIALHLALRRRVAVPPQAIGREGYSRQFTDGLNDIALSSGGDVQILRGAGRTDIPESQTIETLESPGVCRCGRPFISAKIMINTARYEFHAYPHPRATSDSRNWLYFSVIGPGRESYQRAEFQITDEFRWTGPRPLNPVLVKGALRTWMSWPEVQGAIADARLRLPKPTQGARAH